MYTLQYEVLLLCIRIRVYNNYTQLLPVRPIKDRGHLSMVPSMPVDPQHCLSRATAQLAVRTFTRPLSCSDLRVWLARLISYIYIYLYTPSSPLVASPLGLVYTLRFAAPAKPGVWPMTHVYRPTVNYTPQIMHQDWGVGHTLSPRSATIHTRKLTMI